jgi:hypothetical protein
MSARNPARPDHTSRSEDGGRPRLSDLQFRLACTLDPLHDIVGAPNWQDMSAFSPLPAEPVMPAGPWLLVVGMHRSGTSALTGALGRLGMALPVAADRYEYYGPAEGNPEHWESRLMGLHDDGLLELWGGTWDGPPDPDTLAESDLDPTFGELGDPAIAASAAFPDAGPVAWKDPRSCLLLRYWLAHLPKPVAAVFIWRSPLSVARSLRARDGMTLADGVALWERYNRSGLAGLIGVDTFVTTYESIVADPPGSLGAITSWLGKLPQFASYASQWDVEAAASAIDPLLDRHRASGGAELLLEEQSRLQSHLEDLEGQHRPLTSTPPGAESAWTTVVLRHRRQAASLEREIDALKRTFVERDGATQALSHVMSGRIDATRADTRGMRAEMQRLQALLVEMQTDLDAMYELYEGMRAPTRWRMARRLRRVAAFKNRSGSAPSA